MQRLVGFASLSLLFVLAVGCGPSAREDDTGADDTAGPDAAWCTPTSQTETSCDDGFDDDCNGFIDCGDVACAEMELCAPVDCEVSSPSASLVLPDGDCTGIDPGPDAPDAQMEAFLATCGAYEATLDLSGFPAGATLTDPSQFLGVCVNMEHSWLRDLQIEVYCPDGDRVLLSKFRGQDCPNINASCAVYLGVPNDNDEIGQPVPGVGWDYCWTTAATNPSMIDFSNQDNSPPTLPADDYRPSEPFARFQGCALNGAWRIRVVDGWGIDNGHIFETKLMFDPSLSDDCPIIE